MAWGSNTNPVAIGAATKKVHYDDLWDKLQYIKDSVLEATTKMLFGQSSAPTGWTKDTATWTTDSMIVFTTGSIGSGGSDSPSAAHAHTIAHTHDVPYDGWTADAANPSGTLAIGDGTDVGNLNGATADQATGASSAANSGNHTPKYQSVIAATKDTYT